MRKETGTTVIQGGRLFDGTGAAAVADAALVIDDGVVAYAGPEAAMNTLRGAVEDALRHMPEEVQNGVFELLDRADEPGLMTDIISQQFIHDADLRQSLLEMDSIGGRIPVICEFLRNANLSTEE